MTRYLDSLRSATGNFDAFLRGMRELGYVEGKNLTVDWRYAENKLERLPALAAELVALKPDALVSGANVGPPALQRAANTIPIVMTGPSDPVASGLVKSLARPGGNITGHSGIDLSAKRLQLLLDLVPNASPVGLLPSPGNPTNRAVFVGSDPLFSSNGSRIAELAIKNRLPSMTVDRLYVKAGALVSYGANFLVLYHHAAAYVDKIFKGAKPGDLPIERPTTFEPVINMKTAKAIGLKVPQSLIARANEVIQ